MNQLLENEANALIAVVFIAYLRKLNDIDGFLGMT